MKFTVEIEIEKSIDEVIALFDDTDNIYKWMEGLESFEPISGTPGQIGAKSRMRFKMGDRDIEMIESIKEKDLPSSFSATYEADGVFNVVKNEFSSAGENRTLWTSQNEFQFTTLPMKIIAFFMPSAFKKQSVKYLRNFKKFAEEKT